MLNKIVVLALVETVLLLVFLPNIYFEITNSSKTEQWYSTILSDEFNNNGAYAKSVLLSQGFKTIKVSKNNDSSTTYIIAPPYDQGLITSLTNRFLFDIALRQDKNGNYSSSLHK